MSVMRKKVDLGSRLSSEVAKSRSIPSSRPQAEVGSPE